MKKIAFLTPGINVGGAERQLALLANGLKQRDIQPIIISLSPVDVPLRDFENLETYIHPLQKGAGLISGFFELRQKLRELDPDIIQGWMYAGNIFASLCGLSLGKLSLYHSVRASDMDAGRYGLQIRLNGWLSHITKAVAVNSVSGGEFHKKRGFAKAKLVFIPNGIDTEKFHENPQIRKKMRQQLGCTSKDKIILYAARLDPMKAHDTALAVAEKCPEVKFIFAGKGTQTLKAPDNVSCLGSFEEMTKLYNAADLLINLSKFGEGFPNVVGEAMACNLRVLTNDVGDSVSIIGDTGFICDSLDADYISDTIKTIFETDIAKHSPTNPRQNILSSYSVDSMIGAYLRLYDH